MKFITFVFVVLVFCSCGYDSGRADPGESAGADTLHYLAPYDSIDLILVIPATCSVISGGDVLSLMVQ